MRLSQRGNALLVHTPAKVNLVLNVLGRRPDGYHELETMMAAIGLSDTLLFSPAAAGACSLNCRWLTDPGTAAPSDDHNLVLRAARLLAAETGCPSGVSIELIKRIPVQAGLGGGSSDAAATLVGLNRFWNLNLPLPQLHALAARLGSDVNFFVGQTAGALCRGRGEQIEPVPLRRRWNVVIVKPSGGLSTAEVFRHWSECRGTEPQSVPAEKLAERWSAGADRRSLAVANDLEPVARRLHPGVDAILRSWDRSECVAAGMSGSGSACFAICRSARQANRLAQHCRVRKLGETWVTMTEGAGTF